VPDCGDSDNETCMKALIEGLSGRSTRSFLIHLGGTGIIADGQEGSYGELSPKIWSDIDDIDAICSLPDTALHRKVDKLIQDAAAKHGDRLKCAIVCPPAICGAGKGLGRVQSVLLPLFFAEIERRGSAFYIRSGTNAWSWVHINDLMKIYVALVEDAAAGGVKADWGQNVCCRRPAW
jgi:nucleoside-diphosphate-sugar epimerase